LTESKFFYGWLPNIVTGCYVLKSPVGLVGAGGNNDAWRNTFDWVGSEAFESDGLFKVCDAG
jgi:hypothetical protein